MNIHEKFFSKIGFNYFLFGLSSLVIQIMAINIVGAINYNLLTDFNVLTILSSICNYILPFPIIYYLLREIDTNPIEKHNLNITKILKYFAITLTLMWFGNLIGLAITAGIGSLMQSEITNPVQNLISNSDIILNLLIISIIAPIFEELFFRKFLIDRTIKYGAKVSIIISAVIFGFFHGNLNQFFYAFLMGGFFAYVYIKTGKIIYTIILHLAVNLMGSVVSVFVTESAETFISGTYGTFDIIIVLGYMLIIFTAIIIGVISLYKFYTQDRIKESKPQISMEKPIKNILINPGMIIFMLFFTFQIIIQLAM